MRKALFLLLILMTTACVPLAAPESPEPSPSEPVLEDSFFFGRAFLDTNQNGEVDSADRPLQGATFTARDAQGASGGGKTDADGHASAWWPGKTRYPVELRMEPPEGSAYQPVGSNPVILTEGSTAEFLFTDPAAGDPPAAPADQESTPASAADRLSQYRLTATLDYDRHHLAVEQEIDYFNRTGETISDHLLLMVEPAFYPGVFKLNSLSLNRGAAVEDLTWDGTQLKVPLDQPLPPGESAQLSIAYELNLPNPQPSPDIRPIPFGYSERQTNLVDWYPFIPPYIPGSGWLAHRQGYFGEHLAYEIADFEVSIRLAGGRSDLVIAASAPAEADGEWHHYRLEKARNFVWSVSHQYQVLTGKAGAVTVQSYAFPFDVRANQAALDTTIAALELFSELFGPYPRQMLTVVEADFLDGMEYDGLYFLSDGFYNLYQGTQSEYLVAIAAHETAHQWWYGLVGNDQAQEPWLDEALATYSERLYYEHLHPDALPWWWAYRVEYYEPSGWVDGSIYNLGGYRAYRDAVYLNGAVFLEELRELTGDDAFFAFLKDYAAAYAGELATADDFFSTLRRHSQADITPVLDKFFQNR
jgi:hypothetical protein